MTPDLSIQIGPASRLAFELERGELQAAAAWARHTMRTFYLAMSELWGMLQAAQDHREFSDGLVKPLITGCGLVCEMFQHDPDDAITQTLAVRLANLADADLEEPDDDTPEIWQQAIDAWMERLSWGIYRITEAVWMPEPKKRKLKRKKH